MARILFINPGAEMGGAERSLLELMRGLPRDRFEAHLMLPKDGPLAGPAGAAGAEVVINPWPKALLRVGRERTLGNRLLALVAPIALVPVFLRMARYMKRRRIHLIHTNGTKAHLAGCAAAALAGLPLVWHLRDVLAPGPLRSLLRLMSIFPRAIIANSEASASSIPGRRGKVRVVYNGLDLAEFSPVPRDPTLRASLGIGPADFVIGTLGALSPLKGHIHLIRAMPLVLEKAPSARALIVGEEMYETIGHRGHSRLLRDETARLGLDRHVIFAGRRDDATALYAQMDVVTLCSVRPESFGRILVEAMACERPVVATDLGGPREILSEPGCGILVPPADPEALARAILTLQADPGLRGRMGRAGRARVADLFTIERHVAGVCEVYRDVIEEPFAVARGGANEAAP